MTYIAMANHLYKLFSRGPRMDPCGTPQVIGNQEEETPLISVHCTLFDIYVMNQFRQLPLIPYDLKLFRSIL